MSHYFLGTPLVSWLKIKFLKRVFCIFLEQLFLPGCKLFSFLAKQNIFSGCLLFSGWKPIFLKRVFFPRSTLVYWKVSSFLTENCFLEMSEKEQRLSTSMHWVCKLCILCKLCQTDDQLVHVPPCLTHVSHIHVHMSHVHLVWFTLLQEILES